MSKNIRLLFILISGLSLSLMAHANQPDPNDMDGDGYRDSTYGSGTEVNDISNNQYYNNTNANSNRHDSRTMNERLTDARNGLDSAQGNLGASQRALSEAIRAAEQANRYRDDYNPYSDPAVQAAQRQVQANEQAVMQAEQHLRSEQRVAGATNNATDDMRDDVANDLNDAANTYELGGPDSVNRGAKGAQAQQMIGAAMSAAAAAAFFSKCGCPGCQINCVLGGLSAAQAAMMMMGAAQTGSGTINPTNVGYGSSGTSYDPSIYSGSNNPNASGVSTMGGLNSNDPAAIQARGVLNKLKEMGYEFNSDGTVTLPDGTKVSSSAFNSAKGMKDAGFSDAEIANALAAMDQVKAQNAKANVVAVGVEGGGGGRSAGAVNAYGSASRYGKNKYGRKGKDAKRGIASVAGMKKKFGSDMIGVASDDIFKMIRRRYDKKRKSKAFLE